MFEEGEERKVVTDMTGLALSCRSWAKELLCDNDIKEEVLDEFITIDQCSKILRKRCLKEDEELIITNDILSDSVLEISEQMYASALSKLAAADILESAWDEDEQDFVFWRKGDSRYGKT
jgi:hypothetical protein